MNRVDLLLALESELVSTSFLRESRKRRGEPTYEPPPVKKYKRTPEQRERLAAQRKLAKQRERQRWLVLGIVKPKDEQERAWLAAQQKVEPAA